MWKYQILSLFCNEFKAGRLKLPPALKYIKSYQDFFTWTSKLYDKTWVVHLQEQSDNMKHNVEYLGKYLKRPPLGETRIKQYDGSSVSFEYLDHYTDTKTIMQLPVLDFIARLIRHIHDKNFRIIRYYGFLSNRLSEKLLPIVYKLLHQTNNAAIKFYTPWRELLKQFLNNDPLLCPLCKTLLQLCKSVFPSYTLIDMHKETAHGYFPRL